MRVMPSSLPTEVVSRRSWTRLDVRVREAPIIHAPIAHGGTVHWTGPADAAVAPPSGHYIGSQRKADRYDGCKNGGITYFHRLLPFCCLFAFADRVGLLSKGLIKNRWRPSSRM